MRNELIKHVNKIITVHTSPQQLSPEFVEIMESWFHEIFPYMDITHKTSKLKLQKKTLYLPKLAEMVLSDVKTYYEEHKTFNPEIYQQLNAIFPEILIPSLDILDRYKFTKYSIRSKTRSIYKLTSRTEQFTLAEDINYCSCDYFSERVLKNSDAILCQHLLALKMAVIVGAIKEEIVSNAQMQQLLLNDIYNCKFVFKGFDDNDVDKSK